MLCEAERYLSNLKLMIFEEILGKNIPQCL